MILTNTLSDGCRQGVCCWTERSSWA